VIELSCRDCGGPVSEGAFRCRACHRAAWFGGSLPPEEYTAPIPGRLFSGPELLARVWGKGDAR